MIARHRRASERKTSRGGGGYGEQPRFTMLANISHSGWLKTTKFGRSPRIAKQNQHILR
jgi:hypothetical protein